MNSRPILHSEIAPLLEHSEIREQQIHCTFTCPESGLQVPASARLQKSAPSGLKATIGQRIRQTLRQQLSRSVKRSLRSAVGGGATGRMIGQVANDVEQHATRPRFDDSEKQTGEEAAFRSVASQFGWQDANRRYVHRSVLAAENARATTGRAGVALVLCLATLSWGGAELSAQEQVVFTVGGDRAAGKTLATEHGGRWSKSPTKAFKLASKRMAEGGDLEIVIRFASGTYEGDLGAGAFMLPSFRNADCVLRLEGGYDKSFAERDPFGSPTYFSANEHRSAPLLKFRNSSPHDQDELEALILDGVIFDAAGSNGYDAKTNSLIKSASCTQVLIHFGYLKTDLLAIRNCGFLNSPHRAFETLIRPTTDRCEVQLENSLFLNCVIPVKLDTARYRHRPAKITVDHCSFLTNWAFNPDPNTSNPGALELGPKDAADEIVLTNNLFYANFGGAIQAMHTQLPELTISGNNFAGNGLLHGQPALDAVAMIVSSAGTKMPVDVETIEDLDAVVGFEGNVSIAPGLALNASGTAPIDSSEVTADDTWENEVRRLLGRPLQGSTVEVQNYAPRFVYHPEDLPTPTNEAAREHGFSPERARAKSL